MYALLALILLFLCYMCYSQRSKVTRVKSPQSKERLLLVDSSVLDSTPQLVNLTPCYDDACQDYKHLAPEVKQVHAKTVQDFVFSTPNFVLMVWAPWCGYCELFMPDFAAAAKESSIPFALVNAELVPRSLFSDGGGLFTVKGFPTFVKGTVANGKLQLIPLQDRPSKSSLLALAAM